MTDKQTQYIDTFMFTVFLVTYMHIVNVNNSVLTRN